MANFYDGKQLIKNKTQCSILDIKINNNLILYIFEGSLSANDILIKYRENGSRIRTPKHIHWLVDLLIKKEYHHDLVLELLKLISKRWQNIKPLNSRDANTILNNLDISRDKNILEYFNELNKYGYYNIEFLLILMELLMIQEKTNYKDAYMFMKVINSLKNDGDLFSIISTTTHR